MGKEKFKVTVIDFMPYYQKVSCGWEDSAGNKLFLGNVVNRDGEKFLIGYRYGKYVLLPMAGIHYIGISNGSSLVKLNEITAVTDKWLIIGFTDETFFQVLQDLMKD